jgi:hypothetical protein
MRDHRPAPDPNSKQYERPNQNWICGHDAEGKACRIGPDAKGRCRATAECQPALEVKEGDKKGRWRCTRSAENGGPCGNGPQPDGTCGRCITKCVPVRSLRAKRKRFTISFVALTAAVLLIGICGPFRAKFINPGPISAPHSTPAFTAMAGHTNAQAGCVACHQNAHAGPSKLLAAGFNASPGPFQVRGLASTAPQTMTHIDESCQQCHMAHAFHQPNVPREHSCSACHREHQGAGELAKPTDANCLSCHANREVMTAAIQKTKTLPPDAFDFRPEQGRVIFKTPRKQKDRAQLIHSFAEDHPEFQVLEEKLKDPNPLKFNHQLHLTSARITPLKGRALECGDCHKADAAGTYHLEITYEENCKSCHSLQFDVNNPALLVPHGNVDHARAFLRSLPAQYADLATNEKHLTRQPEVDAFVQEQLKQLNGAFASGEELEQRVFFGDARTAPTVNVAAQGARGPTRFPGCAYCHTVAASETGTPQVSQPYIPDRWLVRGEFDHGKHFKVACVKCHNTERSKETSDVLLPTKQTCAECHSSRGGVANSCSTCHSYHTPRKNAVAKK